MLWLRKVDIFIVSKDVLLNGKIPFKDIWINFNVIRMSSNITSEVLIDSAQIRKEPRVQIRDI